MNRKQDLAAINAEVAKLFPGRPVKAAGPHQRVNAMYGAISPKMGKSLQARSTYEPLTKQETAALAWAVKRAAENSTLLHYNGAPFQTGVKSEKSYEAKVKLARSALAKIKRNNGA